MRQADEFSEFKPVIELLNLFQPSLQDGIGF
jgi:hypothetical protein